MVTQLCHNSFTQQLRIFQKSNISNRTRTTVGFLFFFCSFSFFGKRDYIECKSRNKWRKGKTAQLLANQQNTQRHRFTRSIDWQNERWKRTTSIIEVGKTRVINSHCVGDCSEQRVPKLDETLVYERWAPPLVYQKSNTDAGNIHRSGGLILTCWPLTVSFFVKHTSLAANVRYVTALVLPAYHYIGLFDAKLLGEIREEQRILTKKGSPIICKNHTKLTSINKNRRK